MEAQCRAARPATADRRQGVDVDAGGDAQPLEHPEKILSGEVSGSCAGEGAATDPPADASN